MAGTLAGGLEPGDLLAERFRIERRAGEGAMGTVFRALDLRDGQPVALKTFRLDAPVPLPRFARECQALAALRAEGVVRYIDHGVDREGRAFLVMEWIEGTSLAELLDQRGVSPLSALRLAQRLAHALAAMHSAGIVHRDLKPGNIMLPAGELAHARIVDFGIARIAGASAEITTQHGQLGTPRYMAPEQIRDPRAVDGRADVFALGCVLFECLTGTQTFGGDDPVTVLAQVLFQAASEPSALVAALPVAVDRIVASLLAKPREQRPQASALCDELALLLASPLSDELAALPAAPRRHVSFSPSASHTHALALGATLTAYPDAPPLRPSIADWPARMHALQAALPEVSGALIGRERELARLLPALERGEPLVLWGSAGMGKTRLALELATRALARSSAPIDAVLFVELSAARNTEDAVRMVADQARLLPGASDQPEALVGALLAKLGRVLLVLDRVEPLAGQIEPLMRLWTRAAPGLRLIVTSRVRLRLADAFELEPLVTAEHALTDGTSLPPARAGEPTLSAAAQLVHARVRAQLPELPDAHALDPRSTLALERIARALDGIPLAIELAAARAAVVGLDGMLARLSAPLALLGTADGDAHETTMRSAIEWSWSTLSAAERAACMQCAVFRDGFEPDAAHAVVQLDEGAPALPELLRSLRERSLLVSRSVRDDALALRLSMFGAVREFVLEQSAQHAAAQPVLATAADRHARFYAARASELTAQPLTAHGAQSPTALPAQTTARARLVSHDRENLIAAAEHALAAQPPDLLSALALLRALEPVLLARGPSGSLATLLTRALSIAPSAGDKHGNLAEGLPPSAVPADRQLQTAIAAARQLYARLLAPAGRLAQARSELEAALEAATRLALPAQTASVWLDLGVVHHFGRELERARDCYQTALGLLEQLAEPFDDVVSEARCCGNLAAIDHDRGELLAALPGYRRAIALLEANGEPRLLANFCGNLGLCEHELQQLDAARASYQRALLLLEPLGDARLLGIVLSNFGTLELAQGRREQALAAHERACALLQGAGDPRSDGLARGRCAVALCALERVPEAERYAASAERMLRRDPLGGAVLALLRAFLELGHARRALQASDLAHAAAMLDAAQARAARAQRDLLDGRRVYDQCDDVRLYLGVLLPELANARSELANARSGGAHGQGAA